MPEKGGRLIKQYILPVLFPNKMISR